MMQVLIKSKPQAVQEHDLPGRRGSSACAAAAWRPQLLPPCWYFRNSSDLRPAEFSEPPAYWTELGCQPPEGEIFLTLT